MPISSNPCSASRALNSSSSRAPATHPTHASMLRRTADRSRPRTTTSDTAKRPPGFSTRYASWSTRRLSAERFITQFEMITSTDASGSGICSMSPFRNSTFVTPALRWFSRASASISSVMSRPYALPVGPTRLADSRTSMPPPEPRSSTVCPSCSSASAVGLPQPSEASTACSGIPAVSAGSYNFDVIGSDPPVAAAPPQQPLFSPASTRNAASPYFSRTVSLMCWSLIESSLSLAACRPAAPGVFPRLDRGGERADFVRRVAAERVVHPSPLAPIGHEPGVLQGFQVKREARLRRAERGLELAHAALPVGEQSHDLEPGRVRERVEPPRGADRRRQDGRGHGR